MKPVGPAAILNEVIIPAAGLLPEQMDSERAHVLLLAICGQEANWQHRVQVGGPAHGLWQFEQRGGVAGVLLHPASRDMAVAVCGERGLTGTGLVSATYVALPNDDILAACFARLLLWTDPKPLPEVGAKGEAWAYYVRNWRPGKPHPKTWSRVYDTACNTVGA